LAHSGYRGNAEAIHPRFSGLEKFREPIIHASAYKSGVDYKGKNVLVVGCGNSGMEMSLDLSDHDAIDFIVVRTNENASVDVGALAKIRKGKIKVVPAIESLTSGGARFVDPSTNLHAGIATVIFFPL
jgi:thioredoxin reductase